MSGAPPSPIGPPPPLAVSRVILLATGAALLALGGGIAWSGDRLGRSADRYMNSDRARLTVDLVRSGERSVPLRFPGRDSSCGTAQTVVALADPSGGDEPVLAGAESARGTILLTNASGDVVHRSPLTIPYNGGLWQRGVPCGFLPEDLPTGEYRLTVRTGRPAPNAGRRNLFVYDRLYEFEFIDAFVRVLQGAAVALPGLIAVLCYLPGLLRHGLRVAPVPAAGADG